MIAETAIGQRIGSLVLMDSQMDWRTLVSSAEAQSRAQGAEFEAQLMARLSQLQESGLDQDASAADRAMAP